MTNDARDIINGLELIHMCCETIQQSGGCDWCPMGSDCFEYNSLLDSYENIPLGVWEKFIGFADDVDEFMNERNMPKEERELMEWEDEYDRRRKGERDERAIEEM